MGKPAVVLALLVLAAEARPTAPTDPAATDIQGARALALAAYRGLPGGNDGMFFNAGALAARRRYSVEGQYFQEQLVGDRWRQWFQLSVVDSETAPVTAGLAYTRVLSGPGQGNLFHVPVAGAVGGGLYLGATAKYLDVSAVDGSHLAGATADAAFYWQASSLFALGVAGYNLVPLGTGAEAPKGMGAGFSVGDERRFYVAGDWRRDFAPADKPTDAWMVGGEMLLGDMVPVRAGFLKDGIRGGRFWSAGLGLVSTAGVAVDLSWRRSVEYPDDWAVGGALKVFIRTPQ